MAYIDQSMPLNPKGLPIKSYLSPFYKFLWDFVRHNVLPTGNNSNPTLSACRLMISMVNHDRIPFGDIIYNAILGKTIGHGTKHKGTLVFPCLIQRLCERNGAAAAMSQKVSKTFHNSVSSSSENASLRDQLAAKERHIQHLLSLIPPSSSAAAASGVQPDPATVEDSDASAGSDASIGSLAF
ncbi:unnamed protein product [Prunus brigantina]